MTFDPDKTGIGENELNCVKRRAYAFQGVGMDLIFNLMEGGLIKAQAMNQEGDILKDAHIIYSTSGNASELIEAFLVDKILTF